MMKKHVFRSCFVLSFLLAAINAQAGECSNASLKGAYGFHIGATVLPGGTPRGILDRITFDGNGHFTDSVTFNDNGTITRGNASGTYTVNADCTGTFFPPSGGTIQIVIVDAGKEFYQLRAQPSNIVFQSNGAKKQFPDDHDQECSNASLNGTYGFFVGQADIPARTPRAALGRANFDGKGNFTSTVTVNDNGSVTQINDLGPYTVNADCTGRIGILGGTGTIEIVLVDRSNEFYQLQTAPSNIVFLFTVAKKQSPDKENNDNQ